MQKRTSLRIVTVLALALVLSLVPAASMAQTTTIVLVSPPSQSVYVGASVTVNIQVDGITNLYGVDIRLTFDAAKLAAQDADGNAANGVQIASGTFMDAAQGFLAQNSVDNTTGQVQYVFALMAPASPVTGSGVLASITFTTKVQGTAVVSLDSVTLSSEQAQPIPATLMDGSVTVMPTGGPTPVPPAPTPVPGDGFYYTVQWGDTLSAIAIRHGTTVSAIVAANGLANANYIRVGQVLWIPGQAAPPPGPGTCTHAVQAGENLYRIGLLYGVSVDALAVANGILNPNLIYVGQVLTIPGCGQPQPPTGTTYVVQAGDTVYGLALRFGVSSWSIVAANNLTNPNLIYVGQVLIIP